MRRFEGSSVHTGARAAGVALALALAGPQARAEGPGEVDVEVPEPSIYGGAPSATCGWPTTVVVTGGGGLCTGTLVHPELVITAAHCTGNGSGKQIGFGPSGNSRTVNATCYPSPSYNGSATNDIAYCLLGQAVDDVPIVPPLFGCETSYLSPGRQVVIVGYGNTDQNTVGVKYEVTTTINSYQNGEVFIGGNGLDSCSGDSGGPVYVQLDDGSWRVFGVTSYGGACGGGGYYGNMANNLAWIEAQTNLDLSPCFDAQGTWTPNFDCGGFPLDPASGNGTSWAQGCGGGPTQGFSASCGTPFSPEGDEDPPTVNITSPSYGAVFMTGAETTVLVDVTAVADDGAGFGVDHLSLRVDGVDLANTDDSLPPYEWTLEFPMGTWEIEAVAVDFSQNMAVSSPVLIGVDEDPTPDPTGGDGDPGGETGGETGGGGETDGGGETTGGLPPLGGLPTDFGDAEIGCACSTGSGRGGPGLGGLALLALLGLRRRRTRVAG